MAQEFPPVTPSPSTPVSSSNPVAGSPLSFAAQVLGVWLFNESVEDLTGQNDFAPSTGTSTYKRFRKFELTQSQFITRSGLLFENDKSYVADYSTYTYPESFTLSFWYYSPGIVGFCRHVNTRDLETKVAPIIAKADYTTNSSKTILQNSTFAITEVSQSTTHNKIRVYLTENGTSVSHIIHSEPYEPGLHHVLITYIYSQGRLKIDIDGKMGILHTGPVVNLQNTGLLRINSVVPGYLAHKTTQTDAYIFDLVFTTHASVDNESLKVVRHGYEYITLASLFDTRFTYFGFSYTQPSTVSAQKVFVDGSNIFVARSNGEIVKGTRPIWDREYDYSDDSSVASLETTKKDADRIAEWTTRGLRTKGVVVKA